MEWTEGLNALLNQCVFASGYDFEASSSRFCEQATKLHLWTGDGELALTANQCQEQWMVLNPTEEDFDDEDDEAGKESPEENVNECDGHTFQSRATSSIPSNGPNFTDIRQNSEEQEEVVIHDVGPRLELSLSEAELDQLLSTLPPGPESTDTSTSADSKDCHQQSASVHSEMQWVLAFLTDPDTIASVDADAKNLTGSPEKNDDDDNYQVFLQGLHDANLLVPEQTKLASTTHQESQERRNICDIDVSGDESDSEGAAEEWELTRQEMKRSLQLR